MPKKFLYAIILVLLFALFFAVNQEEISLVLFIPIEALTFRVPIALGLFVAFLLGALCVLPFAMFRGRNGKDKED
ncbi:MAG: hypothetical protein Ta2A_06470 [Treponemataceae bacterium]|nr:MAG: hypothetical protein Ta2A_06470 [Treponemataceae bacterium]